MKLKIIADDKIPFLRGALDPYIEMVYLPGSKTTAEEVKEADALITRTRTKCKAPLLDGSRVKLITTATIGYDHIDTNYCNSHGIRWINAPGCNSSSVQQYIATTLISLAKEKHWILSEKTLGIIGVGNVGSKVARVGEALGMKVLLNDPPREAKEGSERFVSLDTLLTQSDIITCHTPLERNGQWPTFHLANETFFSKAKLGVTFINSSRGEVTDSAALKQAVESGKVGTFVLDVWENEPDIDRMLLEKAFIATPHIAGYSNDGKANGTAACVQEISRFFQLEALKEWYPKEIPEPPMTTKFSVNCTGKSNEEILYEAIIHTYPITEDSRRLKQSPESFEQLRGDYWIRREFHHFTINLQDSSKQQEDALKKLGFQIEHEQKTI